MFIFLSYHLLLCRYSQEYDGAGIRPGSRVGYMQGGQAVDEFGHPIELDQYGRPVGYQYDNDVRTSQDDYSYGNARGSYEYR